MAEEVLNDRELDESLNESLRASLREIQARPEEETGLTADPVEKPEKAAPSESAEEKAERARDATGKFAKAEPAKDAPVEAAAATVDDAAPLVTTTGQPLDINRAPASWKPAAKAAWATLPEPIRAEIYRRESDFLNGNKGIRETADFGQRIRETIKPYEMLIQAEGGTPEGAVADTLRTAALFRVGTPQQKLDAIFKLDKQFNAGLGGYIQQEFNRLYAQQTGQQPAQQQAAQPHQFVDPRVDQILGSLQAQERERAAQLERQSNAAVESFMSAVDAQGQPMFPFVDNVIEDMSQRIAAIRRTNPAIDHNEALKQAYDAAVWANPETRAVLMGQQAAQANQPGANLQKVEQARRASAVNVPKRGALPASGPTRTLEETIRDTGRELGMFQ